MDERLGKNFGGAKVFWRKGDFGTIGERSRGGYKLEVAGKDIVVPWVDELARGIHAEGGLVPAELG